MRAGVLLLWLMMAVAARAQTFTKDLTDKEKALLINVSYLQNYGFQYDELARYEQYVKIPFEETKSVQYDYTFSYRSPGQPSLYIRHSVSLELTVTAAMESYTVDELTVRELLAEGLTLNVQKNLHPYGEESSYEYIIEKGVPKGFVYRYRKGKILSSLMIMGLYFENAGEFRTFVTPLIAQTLEAATGL